MSDLEPLKTSELGFTQIADSYVVNRGNQTYQISAEANAQQMLAGGPLAQAIRNASQGYITASTWEDGLALITGIRDGQAARVIESDLGFHLDPVTGESVPNGGEYSWDSAVNGWRWIAFTRQAPVILAANQGAGSANAISAESSETVGEGALVALPIVTDTTQSPVTVSFNGGTPLTIKTNSGNDVSAGGLASGMVALGIVSGSTFRLVSDQASAAILAAAENALEQYETIRDLAESAVQPGAPLVAALENIAATLPTSLPSSPGKLWNNGGLLSIS